MTTTDNYFDFWNIISNELIGDISLTVIVGLGIIYFFASKYNFTYQVTILLSILYLAVISAILVDNIMIWGFVVLIAGTIFYYAISSKLRRG